MKKTSEYIKIRLLNGKVQKRTIYVNEAGERFIYNQKGFYPFEYFVKHRDVIQ